MLPSGSKSIVCILACYYYYTAVEVQSGFFVDTEKSLPREIYVQASIVCGRILVTQLDSGCTQNETL
jgi:hypothetical protein